MIDFDAYRGYLAPAQTAITRWYREGASCREIAEALMEVGVRPPHNAANPREAMTSSVRNCLTQWKLYTPERLRDPLGCLGRPCR